MRVPESPPVSIEFRREYKKVLLVVKANLKVIKNAKFLPISKSEGEPFWFGHFDEVLLSLLEILYLAVTWLWTTKAGTSEAPSDDPRPFGPRKTGRPVAALLGASVH